MNKYLINHTLIYILNNYKFAFNGKEAETNFTEGVYDFGARLYDSRLGRFWGVDPKNNELSFLSSYCFAANSPIKMIDKEGQDFIVKIDEVNKTIVIIATVYTISEKTYQQAQESANVWNQQVTTYEGYSVSFNVNVIPPLYNDKLNSEFFATTSATNNPAGNTYFGNEKSLNEVTTSDLNGRIKYDGGVTYSGKQIRMNTIDGEDQGSFVNDVNHEYGHLFGLSDLGKGIYYKKRGIMDYSSKKIVDQDLKNIVKYAIDNIIIAQTGKAKVSVEGCGDIKNTSFDNITIPDIEAPTNEINIPKQ